MTIVVDNEAFGVLLLIAVVVVIGFRPTLLIGSKKKEEASNQVSADVLRIHKGAQRSEAAPISLFDRGIVECTLINEVTRDLEVTVRAHCREAIRQNKPLRLVLNTFGGSVATAMAIVATLRCFIKEGNVLQIVAMGECHSAGMMILMAAPPECRYAVNGAEFMVHAIRNGVDASRSKHTRKLDEDLVKLLADGSLITSESLHALMTSGKDCFFGAAEALERGVIGGIII